jgi:predicted Rossmann fold nucleotide-binding protein DprA/Smf involved in DNA uptake
MQSMGTSPIQVLTLTPSHAHWPRELDSRLGRDALSRLWAIGRPDILADHKVGLLCSVRCPGDAILGAYDTARKLRDEGVTVVSGFHSPVEKECLLILLRGKQPIIICAARAIDKVRLPSDWRVALDGGRLLIISPFEKKPRRPTVESARQRNELVAALADEVLIVYATPGGQIEQISGMVDRWRIPKRNEHA